MGVPNLIFMALPEYDCEDPEENSTRNGISNQVTHPRSPQMEIRSIMSIIHRTFLPSYVSFMPNKPYNNGAQCISTVKHTKFEFIITLPYHFRRRRKTLRIPLEYTHSCSKHYLITKRNMEHNENLIHSAKWQQL